MFAFSTWALFRRVTRKSNGLGGLVANNELALLGTTGYCITGHGWHSPLPVHPCWAAMTSGVSCILMSVVSA